MIAPPWIPVPPQGYGGTERMVSELVEGLHRRGHDVTLVAPTGSHGSARVLETGPPPDTARMGDLWEETTHAVRAYELLGVPDAPAVDIIHDHTSCSGPALGAFTAGVPVVHTLHGPWTEASRRFFAVVGPMLHLVAISEGQHRANVDVPYTATIHHGIDVRRVHFEPTDDGHLAFVGRATPTKGPLEAIEIAEAAGLPLQLLMKCREPEEVGYWEDVLRPRVERAKDVQVELNPPASLPREVLSRARALLFPIAWEEPFGLVMVEALACGTPVVATRRGSVPEIVTPEVGAVVDPADPIAGSVAALEHLRVDRRACRRRVEEHFPVDRMVDAYEAVYRDILDRRGRTP